MRAHGQQTAFWLTLVVASVLLIEPPDLNASDSSPIENWSKATADRFLGPLVMLVPLGPDRKLTLILAPEQTIYPTKLPAKAQPETAIFDLDISADGAVTKATRTSKQKSNSNEGDYLSQRLKHWRFVPFTQDGRVTSVHVKNVPILVARAPHLAGHTLKYPVTPHFVIYASHSEGGFFGRAQSSSYSVEIVSDGTITYRSERDGAVAGAHRTRIEEKSVHALLDALKGIDPLQAAAKGTRRQYDAFETETISLTLGDKIVFLGWQAANEFFRTRTPNNLDRMTRDVWEAVNIEQLKKNDAPIAPPGQD